MRDKATTCKSTACSSRNTSVSQPLETQISTTHQKQPVPMCQFHVDARFPMERSASTKIRNPSVTLHKQACTMLSKWSVIWVGNTFPQGDAGLLRLLAVHNDLGPAPSTVQSFLPKVHSFTAFPTCSSCTSFNQRPPNGSNLQALKQHSKGKDPKLAAGHTSLQNSKIARIAHPQGPTMLPHMAQCETPGGRQKRHVRHQPYRSVFMALCAGIN